MRFAMNSNLSVVVLLTCLVLHAHVANAMEPVQQPVDDVKSARCDLQEVVVVPPNDSLTSSSLSSLTSSSLSSQSSTLAVPLLSASAEYKAIAVLVPMEETYVKKLWKKYFCLTKSAQSTLGDLFANRNLVGIIM